MPLAAGINPGLASPNPTAAPAILTARFEAVKRLNHRGIGRIEPRVNRSIGSGGLNRNHRAYAPGAIHSATGREFGIAPDMFAIRRA